MLVTTILTSPFFPLPPLFATSSACTPPSIPPVCSAHLQSRYNDTGFYTPCINQESGFETVFQSCHMQEINENTLMHLSLHGWRVWTYQESGFETVFQSCHVQEINENTLMHLSLHGWRVWTFLHLLSTFCSCITEQINFHESSNATRPLKWGPWTNSLEVSIICVIEHLTSFVAKSVIVRSVWKGEPLLRNIQ